MRRGVIALILTVVLFWQFALPCMAAGERGTIRVVLEPEMADGLVALHRVGRLQSEGLELTYTYGGGYVTGADMGTRELACWLAEQGGAGAGKRIARDGTVMFSTLEEGVYLLTQQEASPGYYAMEPVLIAIPEADGTWYAEVSPGVEKTEYRAAETGSPIPPVLIAMAMVLAAFGIGTWYEKWHLRRKIQKNSHGIL